MSKTRWKEKNGDVVISLHDSFDHEDMQAANEAFSKSNFKLGKDYTWSIARGDDIPNALTLTNPAILKNKSLKEDLYWWEGTNCYSA